MAEVSGVIISIAASAQALFAGALLWLVWREHGILKEQAKAIQIQADAQRKTADLQAAVNRRTERLATAQLEHFELLKPKAAVWDATYDRKDGTIWFRMATTSPGGDVVEKIEARLASGHMEPDGDTWTHVEDGHWEWTTLFHREDSDGDDLILAPGAEKSFVFKIKELANLEALLKEDCGAVPIESEAVYVILVVLTALGAEAQCTLQVET